MRVVDFKSVPGYWVKEFSGVKPCTVREFESGDDARRIVLDEFIRDEIKVLYIKIKNTETGQVFDRLVTDVSCWGHFYIISWRAE